MSENVVILGASDKPERYSYKALKMLDEHGHHVIPVHPKLSKIEKIKCIHSLSEINLKVDTLTMYINPDISNKMENEILALKPHRVIFNPGTENPSLEKKLDEIGVKVERACTLVLLSTGQY